MRGFAGRALAAATFAITFLTVLPVGRRADPARGAADAPAWFPLVGALVGGAGAGVLALLEPLLGAVVATILGVLTMVVLTAGLHQDGLADCADGLGVRGDRARRLAVMREPQVGTYGTLALLFWGLLLVAAVAQLGTADAVVALVGAAAIGRWAALLHATWTPAARPDGLGSAFRPARGPLAVACVTVLGVLALAGPLPGAACLAAGALVAAAVSAWSRRALGGRTGDTLGATVVLAELAVCLVLLAVARG